MITVHERYSRDHQARTASDPILGFRWSKAPNSMSKRSILGVLRLRASALSRDRSVRRSAQDDDFAGVSKKNTRKLALTGLGFSTHYGARLFVLTQTLEPLLFPLRYGFRNCRSDSSYFPCESWVGLQHGPVPERLAEDLPGRSPISANFRVFFFETPAKSSS